MQVKLTAIYAGPDQTGQPGQIIRVTDSEGKALIAGKYAEPLNSVTKTEAMGPETMTNEEAQEAIDSGEAEIPEAAIIEPEEKAVMPKAKPKAKRKGKK